jgi:pimeloyl-ACP methyl ester carboxylesterase
MSTTRLRCQRLITPLPKSEEVVSLIPSSRLEVFDRSGHMPMVEEPDKFVDVLRGFLREAGE